MAEEADAYFNKELETMSLADRAAYQSERLRQIVAHAYAHAPAVRAKFEKAGLKPEDVQTVADLAGVPITRKDKLRELQREDPPFGGFLGIAPQELKRVFMSPGPIYEPEGPKSDYWRWAKALYAAGFRPGDVVLNIFSYHMTPAGAMFEEGLRVLGCAVVPAGVGNQELQVQIMHDLKVTGYVGLPSYLMALITKAQEMGYDFRKDFALRTAFVAAEMLPESLRRTLQEEHGVSVCQGYGTAETGNLGYECAMKSGMHIPEDAIVEVVEPESGQPLGPGEVGEVVVTLFEETYPLIRFGTGDLSYYTNEPCPCGRTPHRLVRLVGRVGDAVKVRGMFVHPKQADELIARFPQIANYQIVVTREAHKDYMTFRLELDAGAVVTDELRASLQEKIKEVLKVRADLEFVPPGTIPQDAKKIKDERTWD